MSIEGARSIEAGEQVGLPEQTQLRQNRVTIQTTILIRYAAVDRRGRLADYLPLLSEKTLHLADRIGFMSRVLQRFFQVEKLHELKPETAAVAPVSHAKYPIKRV